MGCDIHSFAEKLNKETNKWENVGKIFKSKYYDPKRENKIDDDGFEWNAQFVEHPYEGRNYNLFAILADVRNGRGFAGIKTGEGFNPISQPKGLPHNVSSSIGAESESWGQDAHSHSFFTVKELEEYDWCQTTSLEGVVSLEEFKELKAQAVNSPESYSGDVSGQNIVVISQQEADAGNIPENKRVYVRMTWEQAYSECASMFLNETIPALRALCDPEDVYFEGIRIVFWFDN